MAEKQNSAQKVLLIRSVAVEKMDGALDACSLRWPDKEIVVITDFAGHPELMADSRVSDALVPNELANGFQGVWDTQEEVEAVVIPVGNENGVGYAKVFRFVSRVRAQEWYLASRATELKRVQFSTILKRVRVEWWARVLLLPVSYVISRMLTFRQPKPVSIV